MSGDRAPQTGPQKLYRLYYTTLSGRIQAREDIEALDDDAAIALVQHKDSAQRRELWRGDRLVRIFELKLAN
ncbi:hypothetical protein LRS10_23565 [Phenylobacterium sp. J426]|uniref:hypothetical protein n=1 Tax=Phenylobacterium sp. J426 TaxID=2898439 RepID=UPI0021519926|nr:hypothetical protein [Phenylobacterium sp. J426]MCR5876870.1 hypothetical protein [Phenylobacterium sp. J426]